VQKFLDGNTPLTELATTYDEIALKYPYNFGRAGLPSYLGILVESVQSAQRILSYNELSELIRAKKRIPAR
jgi:hypothetical protein